jgi:hypothetical protein
MSSENAAEKKTVTIIVNGREKEVEGKEITFAQVVALAFETPPHGGDTIFSVTYRKSGNEHQPEGVMVEGDVVKIKKGTTFNVSATNRS